jgi:hypothetical protein
MAGLIRLRRNHTANATILLGKYSNTDDNELSEAFQATKHVNGIFFDLSNMVYPGSNSNWNLVLRVLATRENLESVKLRGDCYAELRYYSPECVAPFLLAIQQNFNIQTVDLYRLRLSGDSMASFLDRATSITTLKIWSCGMEAPDDALAVAAAVQRNTNIQLLELGELDDASLILILSSLACNTSVRELRLTNYGSSSLDLSRAVGRLLQATSTIQQFEFNGSGNIGLGDNFRSITQGPIQSVTVADVKFENWNFNDLAKVILESKSNLQSLTVKNCSINDTRREEFRSAIFRLLQPNSLLRSLKLHHHHNLLEYGFETPQDFALLLTAVERSPLEGISIGPISEEKCLALIASIPKMHVRTLELLLDRHLHYDRKGDIVQAIKQNASLRTVVAKMGYFVNDCFERNDRMKLTLYSARNEFLAQWIEYRATVPRAACPEYLAVAQSTGADTIFPILQVFAPSLWAVGDE